jgi:hypothetical protein
VKSLTAKVAKPAKENNSLTAKDAKVAKKISKTTKAEPEGREETAPRVAYRKCF